MLPASGFGASVGTATGRIQLDISQLQQAAQMARQVGRQIDQALAGIDGSTRRGGLGFRALADGVGRLRGELAALSLASGATIGLGLNAARDLRNYTIAFRQFVGTQEESEKLTNRLIEQAGKYGLEWRGVLELSRALAPNLKDGVDGLDRMVSQAARLRSVFPTAVRGSETIALGEFVAGQTTSLQRRFNISPNVINAAKAQFTDVNEQLEFILDTYGATEEAALEMADAFTGVRNEAQLLLGEGFRPLFEQLRPVLQQFREMLAATRQVHPGLVQFAAGMTAITAVTAPALLLLERMVTTMRTLKQLGILSALGRGGVVAGAGAAGVFGGIQISRGLGQLTGNRIGDANASLQGVIDLLQKTLFIAATYVVRTAQTVVDVWARTVNSFGNGVDMMLGAMARFVRAVAAFLPNGLGGGALSRSADRLQGAAGGGGGAAALALSQQFRQSTDGFLRNWANLIQGSAASAATGGGGSTLPAANGRGGFTGDQAAAIREWAAGVQRIEQDAAQQRLDATRQYEQQRTATIAQYELSLARDAEDFARNRLRQQQQLENQIADILADGAERDAEWVAENNERIAETRADGLERIAKLESDYARDRERAANDHRDRLLSAAARLDAVAVREEQRRYVTQQSDAETAFNERVASERQSIEERIEQEREGHQERLQEARQADQERIADMREAQAEQQRLEDEDRAIRLQRQADDHQRQLDEQARANAERMAQITAQAARERAALDEDFLQQLASLDLYNQHWLNLQKAKEAQSLASFERWWDQVNEQINATIQGPITEAEAWPTHFVTPRSSALGAGPSASPLAGTTNRNVTIAEGAITVNAAPGQNEAQVARLVRDEMISLLEGVQ